MSSCFLCDCSYTFSADNIHELFVPDYGSGSAETSKLMKQLPIMNGSPGNRVVDQQHFGLGEINYLSYRVKKIEFQCSIDDRDAQLYDVFPDYVLIFKVPLRDPIIDYDFFVLENFILYSEPESILGYTTRYSNKRGNSIGSSDDVKININKPFIVGPRDYVGVFYMLSLPGSSSLIRKVDASAKVWFDIA